MITDFVSSFSYQLLAVSSWLSALAVLMHNFVHIPQRAALQNLERT
jgi:hypothetical protein